MDKTQVERTRKLRERHVEKGLKQVTVWVPGSRVAELKKLAAKWRSARNV